MIPWKQNTGGSRALLQPKGPAAQASGKSTGEEQGSEVQSPWSKDKGGPKLEKQVVRTGGVLAEPLFFQDRGSLSTRDESVLRKHQKISGHMVTVTPG